MAVNLASKYSNKVDERFALESLTESAVHQDYDFEGVNTVKVYSISTATMNSYSRTGTSRYGTPSDLADTVATYTLTRDRSFTFIVDKGDAMDSMNSREAGKALARQLREVVTPEIDTYRISTWVTAATTNGGQPTAADITSSNAYSSFLAGTEYLDNNLVPQTGRICYGTPKFINFIKLDPSFIKSTELAQKMLINGQVGEIDGVAIVKAPASYFPVKTPFVVVHKSAMLAPKKLADYKVHDNPPGINGNLVEGRIYYDAFVLDAKKKAVYRHLTVN
jgi:N4-gp56 family major capsid protein